MKKCRKCRVDLARLEPGQKALIEGSACECKPNAPANPYAKRYREVNGFKDIPVTSELKARLIAAKDRLGMTWNTVLEDLAERLEGLKK